MNSENSAFGRAGAAVAAEQRLIGFKGLVRMLVAAIAAVAIVRSEVSGSLVTIALSAWLAYSAVLLLIPPPMPALLRVLPWVDVAFVLLIFHLSGASSSLDPVLFLPVVISAGHSEPDDTLAISICLAAGACALVALSGDAFPIERGGALTLSFVAAGAGLPVLARRQRRDLMLATTEESPLRPDLGVAPLIEKLMLAFRDGFSAHIVVVGLSMPEGKLRSFMTEAGRRTEEISGNGDGIAETLFLLPPGGITVLRGRRVRQMLDVAATPTAVVEAVEGLAEIVGCKQLMCAAQGQGDGAVRIAIGRKHRAFDRREANWLASTVLHVADTLRYACLIEHLGDEVARMERQRMSRDLHDSAIQPYIGLKFAIEALARKLDAGDPLADDVERLLSMMQSELDSLRGRMRRLRESDGARPLAPQIRRQVTRLAELYGLEVVLDLDDDVNADSEMSGEVLHLVSESLSNVRRHTASTRAEILTRGEDDWLRIEIRDEGQPGAARGDGFEPRSLSERAAALGGYTSVRQEAGDATVSIRIPLENRLEKA